MTTQNARIPVLFATLDQAGPDDAVLFEGRVRPWSGAVAAFEPASGHAPGCTCCAPRGEAGRALGWLLHARARANVPFFHRVIVVARSALGREAVQAALSDDPVASACFRAEWP